MMKRTMVALFAASVLAAGTPGRADDAEGQYSAEIAAELRTIAYTVTRPPMTTARKVTLALAIAGLGADLLRTQACLAHGGKEYNPFARPFVHSLPIAAFATAGVAFAFRVIPRGSAGDYGLGAFAGGQVVNLARPWTCSSAPATEVSRRHAI
jgi:hypothetical protein